jgi:hypothetical protein
MCSGEMPKELIHNTAIGLLKKEVDVINEGYFISPKFYALDYLKTEKDKKSGLMKQFRKKSVKIKGVDREILKSMSIKQFKQIVDSGKYEFTIKRMISFNQKYTRLKFKDQKGFVNLDEIHKELSCEYDKRIRNGNNSEPLSIDTSIDYGQSNTLADVGNVKLNSK